MTTACICPACGHAFDNRPTVVPDGIEMTVHVQRFFAKVFKAPDSDCWMWEGGSRGQNYGSFTFNGRTHPCHRLAHEWLIGPIPAGYHVDHLCHDIATCPGGDTCPHRRCVNPAHLKAVTPAENNARSWSLSALASKKTHCPKGHPYSGSNLSVNRSGHRACRACARESARRYKAKERSEAVRLVADGS